MLCKLFTPEMLLVALAAVVLVCSPSRSDQREIRFDDGGSNLTTVIGLYKDNGASYHQRQDFTLQNIDRIKQIKLQLHVHVGSKIEPAPGETELKVGVRINGGTWHWQDLSSYRDDTSRWIEFAVPVSEFQKGLNRVETNSTVGNFGNMTERSVDILASSGGVLWKRSWHTHDYSHYKHLGDRNWGVRLIIDEAPLPKEKINTLKIFPETVKAVVGEPVQFSLEARDTAGNLVDPGELEWSTNSGTIDEFGLFLAETNVPATITAKAGPLSVTSTCSVDLKPPTGVVAPTSSQRLKAEVKPGHLDLNGTWSFMLDPKGVGEAEKWYERSGLKNWGHIHVPGSWQAQGCGLDYHGTAWYSRELAIPAQWKGKQVWLRFDAVATHAKVWVNGRLAGEHLGDWTPFELRVTDLLRPGKSNSVVVRVIEMPGHFGAGFLPVIAPHFGGIWQSVTAFATGGAHLSDAYVRSDLTTGSAKIEADITGTKNKCSLSAVILDPDGLEVGRTQKIVDAAGWESPTTLKLTVSVKNVLPWSPRDPALYTAKIELQSDDGVLDSREVRFGFRTVNTKGTQLLLNGEPVYAQGILHWGYYPDLVSIDPSEERIRREFADLKAHGFNMVKTCLFFMPKRFYEIADEMGMLIWQEYPVWQTFPKDNESGDRPEIVREYGEWFRFDRSHPSVILRSLTCEAPSMHQNLMETVYSLGKSLTGGELIEDDSGYRLNSTHTDWYDIHMYADVDVFPGLWSQHWQPALAKQPAKPYIVGEDLDYDTYRSLAAVRSGLCPNGIQPWWLERDAGWPQQAATEDKLIRQFGSNWPAEIHWRQNRHSLASRKAEMEEYRKQLEFAGHVMTGIRDNMLTRCGLYDDLEQPKWSPEELRPFLGDTVLLLDTSRQSRCFRFDEVVTIKLLLSNFGEPVRDATLIWRLMHGEKLLSQGNSIVSAERGVITRLSEIRLSVSVQSPPIQCRLLVELKAPGRTVRNDWLLWFFPEAGHPKPDAVLVTESLDAKTSKALFDGATVLYLPSDEDKSLPRRESPFWREMAIWLPTGHPVLGDFPHDGFVDLQFFNMSQRKPFDTHEFRSEITPLLWGINSRYMGGVVLVDYVFEARVGKGRLLTCCLNTRGDDNVAGRYLLDMLVRYASSDAFSPSGSGDGKLAQLLKRLE